MSSHFRILEYLGGGLPFFIFILWASCLQVHGQTPALKFERLSEEHGLAHNYANWITQDRRGFIWIGTDNGLSRFDGYRFKNYKYDSAQPGSISGNEVWCICEDRNGTLWFGTNNGGLCKYHRETDTFTSFKHDPHDSSTISSNSMLSMYEDRQNTLWLATVGGGLCRVNREDGNAITFTAYLQDAPQKLGSVNNINSLCEDRSGNFWIGTQGGLFIFDRKNERFLPSPFPELQDAWIPFITETPDGFLWISALNRLFQHDQEKGAMKSYEFGPPVRASGAPINAILPDPPHALWLGTYNGLYFFNYQTNEHAHYQYEHNNSASLSGDHVTTLFRDNAGNIFIGTNEDGINKLNPNQHQFNHHVPYRLLKAGINWVTSFYPENSGALWFGTHGGLSKVSASGLDEKYYYRDPNTPQGISDSWVSSFHVDREGIFWLGTMGGGLNKFIPTNEKFVHFKHDSENPLSLSEDRITTVYEDRHGYLWLGTFLDGLNRFDKRTEAFIHFKHDPLDSFSLGHDYVKAISEDSFGELWIGTEGGGLSQLVRDSGKFSNYQHDPADPHSLSDSRVYAIYENLRDGESTLWIGTAAGLNRFNRDQKNFERFTNANGLLSDFVIGINSDSYNNLWLMTTEGIVRFNPADENKRYKIYTLNEIGLNLITPGSLYKSRRGELFVGGKYGYLRFHPDSLKANLNVPPIALTSFMIANQKIALDSAITEKKTIRLAHDQNFFSFEFASLDFTAPAKNRYAYKLEGLQADWIEAGSRNFADFTNVPPGAYTFRVKGANNDGVWNEEGAAVQIIIAPPWWQTAWAYVLYAVLIGAALFGFRRFEMSKIKLRNELKMKGFEAQKLHEVDQMKSRFFANISHEFRTPLTLILGPVEQMLAGKFTGDPKEYYNMILRNGRRLLRLINQLLDLSKLEAGRTSLHVRPENIIPLLKGLVLSFASLAERKSITLKFTSADECIIVYVDRDKLEKIVSNLLSNAFKFTPEGGAVEVAVGSGSGSSSSSSSSSPMQPLTATASATANFISISVRDTGIGIPADRLEKIFDRFYQVDDTHTRKYEGTGIGLALTKELVELHHGEILVSSELGKGTTFVVRLRLGKSHLRDEEIDHTFLDEGAQAEARREEIPEDEPGEKDRAPVVDGAFDEDENATIILIVEDNPDVRVYIRQNLEPAYRIVEANDGEEGVAKAREIIPDLVISDVMMPNMDGYELCQALKSDERTSHIPIILLTAKASGESKVKGLETGADDYLIKPFNPRELLARVKNLIRLRQQLRTRFSREVVLKPSEVAVTPMDEAFLLRVQSVVEKHLGEEDFSVELLGRKVGMSRTQVHRKLRALVDQSASQFIRSLRLQRAVDLLKQNAGTVAEIAYAVGFNDQAYFTKCFHKQFGCPPKEYARRSAKGEERREMGEG